MDSDEPQGADELQKVTAAQLRRGASTCGRRLAKDLAEPRDRQRGSGARFALANRLHGDARLAHATPGPPSPAGFVAPTDLEPEQRRVYEAAVQGYLACFGSVPTRLDDAAVDEWETAHRDRGVRLVGQVGLPLVHPDGTHELRRLLLGGRPLDDVDLRFSALRARGWHDGPLRIVSADLLDARVVTVELDLAASAAELDDWLGERVGALREHATRARPQVGSDCARCPYVAGCPPHRAP